MNMLVPVIEAKGISKAFSGNRVLNNVSLTVHAGEVLCLVGENGCGKSTLIKIISGVYTHDAGTLQVNGKPYDRITPSQSIAEGIQVIYQDFSVFPNLTVAENIAMSDSIQQKHTLVNWSRNRKRAAEALERIGVEIDLDIEVGKISVAQKQIVAISRAILQDTRLIIMDEPTTALTQKEIERLFDIIRGLKEQGIAVIFVSHKLDEVFAVCDRIMVLRSGELVIDESVDRFPREKLIYYMTGKQIEESPYCCQSSSEIPLLEVQGISRRGSFEQVSFMVRPGEILAITGQLGSGRTELATALFGIHRVDSGTILVNGRKTEIRRRQDALKCGIAYLPEDRLSEGLFMNRSLGDNFSSAIIDRMKSWHGIIPERRIKNLSDHWMRELNMSVKAYTTPAHNFSGGNQQRIVLGKWLAAEPRIFIMNCPTVGVDVKSKSEIHQIMKDLAAKGLAIVMISDDIGEILSTSNRVIVMNGGRMTFAGETSHLTHDQLSERIIAAT